MAGERVNELLSHCWSGWTWALTSADQYLISFCAAKSILLQSAIFFMSIRLKIELTRCMTTGSEMYRGRPGSLWWWMLHNSVRQMKTSNTIYLMHCKVLHPWLLLNAIQYPSGVSKKHLTTCGKTIKATVGYMVKFGCTWRTRGKGGKQA